MKTRNGFVSNSSSSSFVVAFPNKPKNAEDILKFMFNGKEGELSVYDYDGLSYSQISDIIFNDIKKVNFKPATKENIIEVFSGRYRYHTESNTFWDGRINDEDGGAWHYHIGRYFGNNKDLMKKLKAAIMAEYELEKKNREEEKEILKRVGPRPEYAYVGRINPYTNNPYTDEDKEVTDNRTYNKKLDDFMKRDKKFLAFRKKMSAEHSIYWKKIRRLEEKIAEEDAKNFLGDNKDKFVFIVTYSDNDGQQGCTMEHGDIFINVPHVQISNH